MSLFHYFGFDFGSETGGSDSIFELLIFKRCFTVLNRRFPAILARFHGFPAVFRRVEPPAQNRRFRHNFRILEPEPKPKTLVISIRSGPPLGHIMQSARLPTDRRRLRGGPLLTRQNHPRNKSLCGTTGLYSLTAEEKIQA